MEPAGGGGEQPAETPLLRCGRCSVRGGSLLMVSMVGGVALGFVSGALLGPLALPPLALTLLGLPGELLLRALKCLVLPLIVSSMVVGVGTVGAVGGLGSLGRKALVYFVATTLLAACLGVLLVSLIRPGRLKPADRAAIAPDAAEHGGLLENLIGLLRLLVPDNLVAAASSFNILGLLLFSLALGWALTAVRTPQTGALLQVFAGLNEAIMALVQVVVAVAPLGIASIIAARLAGQSAFWQALASLVLYALTVLAGLCVYALVVVPLLYFAFTRRNPLAYAAGLAQALLTAFGTGSSSATLPLTLRCVQQLGVTPHTAKFVLTLGTTVNLNGTALYEAVAAIFVAQINDVALSLPQLVVVSLVATLAAIGAAGIPEAGLVTLVLVLQTVNLPVEDIGYILAIDWFLDRCRTLVNVLADAVAAAAIDAWDGGPHAPAPADQPPDAAAAAADSTSAASDAAGSGQLQIAVEQPSD